MKKHLTTSIAVRATLLGIGLSALTACGAIQPVNSSLAPMSYRSSTILTSDEIARSNGANGATAYDLVAKMRPAFLQSARGATAHSERRVYVDGVFVGGLSQLRMIPSATVREIRFLNSIDATTLYGMGNTGGAVMIVTGSAADR
jgi:hypothetical protein